MASIRLKVNTDGSLGERIQQAVNPEYLLRPICFDIIELMKKRIHIDGVATNGSPIGTYSDSYLALRAKKFSRSGDKKVIVSLTRQLENDWAVIATPKGYGVGFLNSFNLQKARYVEANKAKKIFSLSAAETEYVIETASDLVKAALQ